MGTYVTKALFSFHLDEFTGRVTLQREETRRTIYFQKGVAAFVESSLRDESLGRILLRQKKINNDQYLASLMQAEKGKKTEAEAIADLKVLTPFEVYEALRAQAEHIIHNCFLLDRAVLMVEEGVSHPTSSQAFPIDFFRVFLYTAYLAHSMEPGNPLFAKLPVRLTQRGQAYLKKQTLRPIEAKIVGVLETHVPFEEILKAFPDNQTEAEALVEALRSVDLVETGAEAHLITPEPTEIEPPPTKPKVDPLEREPIVSPIRPEPVTPPISTSPIYAWTIRLNQSHHRLLEIPEDASPAIARNAYEKWVKELHLNAIGEHYAENDRKAAETVLDRLTLAMIVLTGQVEEEAQPETKAAGIQVPSGSVKAEVFAQKARLDLKSKRYGEAWENLQKAIELDPKEPAYHYELAEILMQRSLPKKRGLPSQLLLHLNNALRLDSSYYPAHMLLGELAKVRGDLEQARDHFLQVLKIRPDERKARAELRYLQKHFSTHSRLGTPTVRLSFAAGLLMVVGLLIWVSIPSKPKVPIAGPATITKVSLQDGNLVLHTTQAAWDSLTRQEKGEALEHLEKYAREKMAKQARLLDENGNSLALLMNAFTGSGKGYEKRILR